MCGIFFVLVLKKCLQMLEQNTHVITHWLQLLKLLNDPVNPALV